MVDISGKIEQIFQLVKSGEYFVVNRPRQFGKTTTLMLLSRYLNMKDDYLALNISFEDIDSDTHKNQERFVSEILIMLTNSFKFLNLPEAADFIEQEIETAKSFLSLSRIITRLCRDILADKSIVLVIDEVDKSSDNRLFLDFIAMLRKKYLERDIGHDYTFKSVILAGVHDIKTLKSNIRQDDERRYNSPWNIAVDFEVDLSFNPSEIMTMIEDYAREKGISPEISSIAEKLYYYTSGYPYLVSKLCKFIDEKIIAGRMDKNWYPGDVETSFKMIVDEAYTTTLFDSLIKNLENNKNLYDNVFHIVINGRKIPFNITVPVINLGHLYGIFTPSPEGCKIHNRIFEQRIYSYMITKMLTSNPEHLMSIQPDYYTDHGLNIKLILQKFQTFMKEHYSKHDAKFLEREGRLLFLSFLRPIINGKGFDFKEPNVSEERRMDIVITFLDNRYIIELKIWHGSKYHEQGLKQLSDYLETFSLKQGYLLIYDFNKNKEYKQENISFEDKQIFAVWV
ncbi:AAA ATPase-like domain-containing protein, GxxExxY domain-containing [Desulfonema limicola]|uniref:AAA ATPase-like domain-containing protein, GxxExxY domain-containing n=2 Tax=Desulfonema limicola TaxID=45656 RepID=A0A975B507_9BACT|nr:AAA ATPase-like domain-containing protein, GxxExxY domain-containing [Desulfonema limicola]